MRAVRATVMLKTFDHQRFFTTGEVRIDEGLLAVAEGRYGVPDSTVSSSTRLQLPHSPTS
jgi:hypothetical protein